MQILNLAQLSLLRRKIRINCDGIKIVGINRKGHGIRGLAISGLDIEPELRFIPGLLKSGDIFIDIGANTGIYSLLASRLVGSSGKVIAFEPNLQMCSLFTESVELNEFTNIDLFGFAIGNECKLDKLQMNFEKPNSYSLISYESNPLSRTTFVFSLDTFLKFYDDVNPSYVKIDVEGSEEQVLFGMKQTIKRCRPIIQYEVAIKHIDANLYNYRKVRIVNSPNQILVPEEKYPQVAKLLNPT